MRIVRPAPALAATLFAILAAHPAHAASNRIFMSTNGNNSSDCANPLTPCLTFVGALAQVNAGGEVIAEATGGYGPLTITQAVTISGPPGVVIYSGVGVTVNAPAATVTLRGLTIDGTGAATNGINVVAVGVLNVEHCLIANFSMNGILMSAAGQLNVRDTDVKGCDAGIQISNTTGVVQTTIDHSHLDGNVNGFQSQSVSPGSSIATATFSTANQNLTGWICGNASSGINQLSLDWCTASQNSADGLYSDSTNFGSALTYSFCVITQNGVVGVGQVHNGTVASRGNNTITGNAFGPASGTVGSFSPM